MTELVWGLPGVNRDKAMTRKKTRSLSYTGCWTCRERRVKCDERPVSCGNCNRANRVCGGYDVRLVWATDERGRRVKRPARRNAIGRDKRNISRGPQNDRSVTVVHRGNGTEPSSANNAPSSRSPIPPVLVQATLEDPNEPEPTSPWLLTDLKEDEVLVDESNSRSVVPVAGCEINTLERASPPLFSIWNQESTLESIYDFVQLCVGSSEASEASVPYLTSVGQAIDGLWSVSEIEREGIAAHDPDQIDSNASMTLIPYETDLILEDNSDIIPQSSIYQPPLSGIAVEFLPSLDQELLFREPPSRILLREFSDRLCCLMQPVFHRENPFKNIYLTTALDGFRYLDTGQACTQLSLASISVYHSVLATAAIHLRSHVLPSSRSYIDKIACVHRTKGLEAARGALEGNISSYRHVLTAILCLVSVDIIDGGVKDHWIHLEAATKLQKTRQRLTLVSRQTQQLNTICSMLSLFTQTALYNFDPQPWHYDLLTADEPTQDGFSNCVEFLYGTTPTITKAIFKVLRLSQCLNFYRNQILPEALLEACENVHDEILSWNIDLEYFSTIDNTDATMVKMARAQAIAFYNSTLIYYYRSIQNCRRMDLKKEQREVLEAMNLVEDIKSSSRGQMYSAAPVTWPAFIASCEATGQDRDAWAEWWGRVKCYRMANYVKQKSIIDSVWERIDGSYDMTDWREVLSTMGIRVIPV